LSLFFSCLCLVWGAGFCWQTRKMEMAATSGGGGCAACLCISCAVCAPMWLLMCWQRQQLIDPAACAHTTHKKA
jgi:hypothetical protein